MFHNDWILSQLAQERHRDLMRQVEQDRLVQQHDPDRPQRRHTIYHALDLLGKQLIMLGEYLRAKHAAIHTRSLTHTS